MKKLSFVFLTILLGALFGIRGVKADNWVEVATYSGSGSSMGFAEPFTVNYQEWRIRWQNSPYFSFGDQSFYFEIRRTEDNVPERLNLNSPVAFVSSLEQNGTLNVDGPTGTFNIRTIPTTSNYTLIVEQNVDSIPEFPSWIVLALFLVGTFYVAMFKKGCSLKAHKNG